MSKDSVRASGAEGPGRLGEGRVYADIYRHGTNPRSTTKYFRGFTVRAYFQCALHCYSDAWRTIVQRFITVLLSFERPKPRQYPSARDWPYPGSTTITMANGAVTSMAWILEPSATGLCEPDLHVFAKLFEDRLERGLEAQALSAREIGGDDDVLNFFVGHLVDVDLTRQPAS